MLRKNILLLFLMGVFGIAEAQDPQLSQFYAAPMYHNPAFAGSAHVPRFMVNYRNQWPSLSANYVTSVVSGDFYFDKFNSGVGVVLMNDTQGAGRIKTTEASLLYAYQLQLTDDSFLRLGVQGTYSNRGIDVDGLVFGDQWNGTSFSKPLTDPLVLSNSFKNASDFDASAGLLYYNPKYWIGFSSHHLTQPTVSFIADDPTSTTSIGGNLPRKYTLTGGYNIPLGNPYSNGGNADKELIATPAFLIKKQGVFSQLDLGAYLTYSPLTVGLWYRGIPLKKHGTSSVNNDALVALAGFRFDDFSFGYSYDLTVSSLGFSTGGAHEISISYVFNNFESKLPPHAKRRRKELSCPKF